MVIHPFDSISLWVAIKFTTIRDVDGRRNYFGTFQPIVDWEAENDADADADADDGEAARRRGSTTPFSPPLTRSSSSSLLSPPSTSSSTSTTMMTTQFSFLTPLDETFGFLTELEHPPLVALLMRRPRGIKALECHVFKAGSDDEALDIVEALDICQVRAP